MTLRWRVCLLCVFMLIVACRSFLPRVATLSHHSSLHHQPFRPALRHPKSPTRNMATVNGVNTLKRIRAKIVSDVHSCGERIRCGDLVAFPTETVYGLGCHALDPSAVAKVFQAKERPLTDPLIVHVLSSDDAFQLWSIQRESIPGKILETLCKEFWPGPLTLVAKADRSVVPDTIMANTGFCACRSPSHPVARQLIEISQRPLAAPSANKFGHVSPTTAQHVWDDLQHEDVWILRKGESSDDNEKSLTCNVGVESTVAKLDTDETGEHVLTVLRQGAVSVTEMQHALKEQPVRVEAKLKRATKDDTANVAPGQTIRHYSPNIPSFLVNDKLVQREASLDGLDAVVIDYSGHLSKWEASAKSYWDISCTGDSSEAAKHVFQALRSAEQVEGADCILFPDLPTDMTDALAMAVKDRLTRAASGVVLDTLSSIKNGRLRKAD